MKLQLFYPVYPFHLNQGFGSNLPCAKDYLLPTQQIVNGADNNTCPPGFRKLYPLLGLPLGHNGLDLMAGEQLCFAACEGTVTQVSLDVHRGLGVYVTTDNKYDVGLDQPYRISVVYWHFKEDKVKVGDKIKVGDVLGITDSTGASSGNHLHFEIIPIVTDQYNRPQIAVANAFQGAIDPAPFLNGIYASVTKPKYTFTRQLKYGDMGLDVIAMQRVLAYEGLFPYFTFGFYGELTSEGMLQFQLKHNIDTFDNLKPLMGHFVGPKTLAYLQANYS